MTPITTKNKEIQYKGKQFMPLLIIEDEVDLKHPLVTKFQIEHKELYEAKDFSLEVIKHPNEETLSYCIAAPKEFHQWMKEKRLDFNQIHYRLKEVDIILCRRMNNFTIEKLYWSKSTLFYLVKRTYKEGIYLNTREYLISFNELNKLYKSSLIG